MSASTVEGLRPVKVLGTSVKDKSLESESKVKSTFKVLEPIVKGELLEGDTNPGIFLNGDNEEIFKEAKEIVEIFKEKFKHATTPQKNAFLNKLGIEVINDNNPTPKISTEKISDSALHSLTQELLIQQASEQTGQNTFLRTDYGYLSISKKLLAEEGRRHPLEEGGKVPDVIVDHLKAILKAAPKVLNSENGISIEDIARVVSFNIYNTYTGVLPVIDNEDLAMKLAPSYTLDLSALRKDSLPDDVALKSIKGLAETFDPEVIAVPVVVAPVASTPSLRASFSEKISEGFFGVKPFINKFVGTVESFIYDPINLINEGIKAVTMNVDHQDLAIEVEGEDADHNDSI